MRKTSWLQRGQTGASLSWDVFNFYLYEKFHPGLQESKCHVVFFLIYFSLILVTVQPSFLSIQHSL